MSTRPRTGLIAWLTVPLFLFGCGIKIDDPPVQPEDTAPSWAPDGTRIAFVRYVPYIADTVDPTGIYVTDLAGQTQQVVNSPSARSVDWSPDGRWLVFNDATGMHVVLASGDSMTTIYSGGSFPSWSPDGTEIAFSTNSSVWGLAPDGSNLRRITPLDSIAVDADWFPDGQRLVVLGNPHSEGEEVMIFSLRDQSFTRLTHDEHEDRSPTCSSQGLIAWNPWPIDTQGEARQEIWVMDSLGTNPRGLATAISAPSWDPTGRQLVFSDQTSSSVRLFVINADGTGLRQLTH